MPIRTSVRPSTCQHLLTRIGPVTLAAACALVAAAQISTLPPARFVSDNDLLLTYATRGSAAVERLSVYVSSDGGRTWVPIAHAPAGPGTASVHVEHDGRYDFFMVLENAAGRSSPPPQTGSAPHASIYVDTTAPTLQLHDAQIQRDASGGLVARVELTLIEENLAEGGLRLFYRIKNAPQWVDVGARQTPGRVFERPLPADLHGAVDLRVVATDMAGNRTFDDRLGVTVPPLAAEKPAPASQPTSQPVATSPPTSQTATPPLPTPKVIALRRMAREYMRRGEYSLAVARLSEALELSPDDPGLLVELGQAIYGTRDLAAAAGRYQQALTLAPDDTGALEGLALVEARQRHYPAARGYLEHLLRLQPQSGRMWLNYGDVLHRLGEGSAAVEAWSRVLETKADAQVREMARQRLRYLDAQHKP